MTFIDPALSFIENLYLHNINILIKFWKKSDFKQNVSNKK